jgi:hypothetical protein
MIDLKNNGPLVSVVMPSYNTAESFLRRAIESVLSQTYQNLELIVVDDASTAGDSDIVRSYEDSRIVLLRNDENRHVAATVNRGMEIARGQYIARMDSDDVCLPRRIEKQVAYLMRHPDIDIVCAQARLFGARSGAFAPRVTKAARMRTELFFNCGVVHPTVMFRADFIRKHNLRYEEGLNYRAAEDYEMWTRCADLGNMAEYPHILLNYRVHTGQVSTAAGGRQQAATLRVRLRQLARLGISPDEHETAVHDQFCTGSPGENISPEETQAWALRLLDANARLRVYPVQLFTRTVLQRFLIIMAKLMASRRAAPLALLRLPLMRRALNPARFPGYIAHLMFSRRFNRGSKMITDTKDDNIKKPAGRRLINKRNILSALLVLALIAAAVVIQTMAQRQSVLEFMAGHSTGWENGFAAPQDAQWYTVENGRFGIDNTGDNARATTNGINEALAWAKEQGYSNIRFPAGTYSIQCLWRNRFEAPTDGILVPSGLTLDLGDATFAIEPNSDPEYTIFGIVNASDVTILGGTLLGDRDAHQYVQSELSPSHEYGFGICVSASSNVIIQGVTIKDMTGDGVIIEGSYIAMAEGGMVSSGIKVLGCSISNCRRQGVSVIGAVDSEIAHNRIWDISGTNPQFAIDVEPEMDYIVNNLIIHHNVVAGCTGGAISCHSGSHYQVFDNACRGDVLAVFSDNVRIYDNLIEAGQLYIYEGASDIELFDNELGTGARLVQENE